MKILVTGFNPFGGEKINPAWEAVSRLPKEIDGSIIKAVQIPTEFETSAERLLEEMRDFQPDVVICVGQAGGRFAITPERVAINIDDARISDNAKQQPIDIPIREDGQPAYFSTLPVKAMVEAMKSQGIPAQLSNSAGTFVCNHIMYQLLYFIEKEFPKIKGGFIHVPFITEQVVDKPQQPSMSLELIISGLQVCLKTVIEYDGKSDLKAVGGAEY